MIYADHAATTPLDLDAFEAMKPFLCGEYANPSQPYSFASAPKRALRQARKMIADCIGAQPEELYFTSGGTEGDNWAIKGSMTYGDERAVITSSIEHHAVLNACRTVERFGVPVMYLPVSRTGELKPCTLDSSITAHTKLVSVMLANNEIGTIQPIQALASIAHANGAIFHTDAVQAVGHIPIDVQALGVDLLSASAHKFNGPRGIGFLYIKKGTPLLPYIDGGAQEYGMRGGTENVAAIVGMAAALKKNCDEMEQSQKKLCRIEQRLLNTLSAAGIPFLRNGGENHLPGNVSLSFHKTSGELLLHRLDLMGICVSTGSACDSVRTQLSHVIEAIGVPKDYAEGTIRISFGRTNVESDGAFIGTSLIHILRDKGHSKAETP